MNLKIYRGSTIMSGQKIKKISIVASLVLLGVGFIPAGFGAAKSCYILTSNLSKGTVSQDVSYLQKALIKENLLSLSAPTTYFGNLTFAAVVAFQEKYAFDILTPLGLTQGTGYVGASTRAKLNALNPCVVYLPSIALPGQHCGGNMANAPVCGEGYSCTPVPGSNLPFGDVGGTCTANQPIPVTGGQQWQGVASNVTFPNLYTESFTLTTASNITYTVNFTNNAQGNFGTNSLPYIKPGDTFMVQGSLSGNMITASSLRDTTGQ